MVYTLLLGEVSMRSVTCVVKSPQGVDSPTLTVGCQGHGNF